MPDVTVVVNQAEDERVVQRLARALRANDIYARSLRDFADSYEDEQRIFGIKFNPVPGQILVCNFGLGFKPPEPVKVRPVLVISPKADAWTGLCTVLTISSQRPDPIEPYHMQLPEGLLPSDKYPEAWIKGDLLTTVGHHRLDRMMVGRREYVTPVVGADVLREARRCALHVLGMHSLTIHW